MAQAHSPENSDPQPGFLSSQEALQETYDLSDFPNEVLVLMDTTHVGDIVSGHVVATLPSEDGTCEADKGPFPGLSVRVGVAPGVKEVTLENTGISTGRPVEFAGQPVVTCVFHADIEAGMNGIERITDVAFINGIADSSLPAGTSIGVAARLSDTGATPGQDDHEH